MVIAVHIDPIPTLPVQKYFIHKLIAELCLLRPDYSFCLLVNNNWDNDLVVENVSVIPLPEFGSLLREYRMRSFLQKKLKAVKADVFISLTGYSSLNTIPIYVFADNDLFVPKNKKLKEKQLQDIGVAKAIFVFSRKEQKYLTGQNGLPEEKTIVIYGAARELYHPTTIEEQTAIKERYTDATEYLLYNGLLYPEHMVQLLKAFSLFKKRQKTTMKIILATSSSAHQQELIKLLGSYRYRADVVLQTDIAELEMAQLVAAAYAYIDPFNERTLISSLSAMQAGCPVITTSDSAITEFSIDAALFYNKDDSTDLAEKMMRIYKDEDTRSNLVKKGFELNSTFSWQHTINTVITQIEAYNS